jgi:hypothetical protein
VFDARIHALGVLAALDRLRGNGRLWRGVWIGTLAGLLAVVAYDVLRLPFVFAREWGSPSLSRR